MIAAALPHSPEAPSSDTLLRCLVLALLLHVCLLVWVGNVPGGSAAPGQGLWGRVDAIELRLGAPGGTDAPSSSTAPPAALPERGPAGEAAVPRQGGAVRDEGSTPPPREAEPGAAYLGDWAPTPRPPAAERDLLPVATAPMPAAVSSPLVLPELGRVAPAERALAPSAVQRAPAAVAPSLERVAPAAVAPLAPPAALPELAAPPRVVLPTPAPPPAAPAAVQPLPAVAPAAPVVPAPSLPAALPVPVLVPAPVPVPTPTAAPTPAAPSSPAAPAADPAPAPSAPAPAGPPAITAPIQSGAGRGAVDAGPRVGPDAATAPSAAASSPAPLNLALPRNRGGPLSGGSTPGVLSLLPRPPEKNKLADAVEKSAKEDCRTAYSGAGLLAVVPLAVDAVRKDGCKW